MAALAGMGHFCVQLILYKRFACAKIAENLAESAFSGLFKREICAKSGGSCLHSDVFLYGHARLNSPPLVRLIFSTLPMSLWT